MSEESGARTQVHECVYIRGMRRAWTGTYTIP